MGAGQMAGRIDHHHDDEPERERDPVRPQGAVAFGVRDDRPATREDEGERREGLGEAASRE